jgi:diphthine synthase
MNAVGACGLQLYRYGEAVSIVFFTDTWRPDSFYDKIANNRKMVRGVTATEGLSLPSSTSSPVHSHLRRGLRSLGGSQGLHTLCLLDIKVKEPNLEQLCRGRTVYEPPRYMTVNQV